MDEFLGELIKHYSLTPIEENNVRKEIIDCYASGVKTMQKPKLVILAAQPGAGKTELEKLTKTEVNNNIVTCNLDNLRDFHPLACEIKKRHEKNYPDITTHFAHQWALALQKHCRQNKLSYMLETTFQNGVGVNNILSRTKAEGYSTEIKLLAVNGRLSFLGTEYRYEKMLKEEGVARIVGKKVHDDRYNAIPKALDYVYQNKNYDDLKIYTRGSTDEGGTVKLIAQNPQNPVEVYLKERDRIWTKKENEDFAVSLAQVIKMKEQRGVNKFDIVLLKNAIDSYFPRQAIQIRKKI